MWHTVFYYLNNTTYILSSVGWSALIGIVKICLIGSAADKTCSFTYVCTVIFAELGKRIEDQARYLLSILIGGEEGMEMGGHGIRYSVIAILFFLAYIFLKV